MNNLTFDIDIIYDDGTKETIPMVRGIVYNIIMTDNELLIVDAHTEISRIKKLHTTPVNITIRNIRNIFTNKKVFTYRIKD